jgi:uncharacterized membrane protein
MDFARLLRHLAAPPWIARRAFPRAALDRIEQAIRESERLHEGELRFAIEAGLDLGLLARDVGPRERAGQVFASLGVWNTAHNSGVLIYVQAVDRRIEIVADRGISAKVAQAEWDAICRRMEDAFRAGRHERGVLDGIGEITALLARHFPARGDNPDELPDRPALL